MRSLFWGSPGPMDSMAELAAGQGMRPALTALATMQDQHRRSMLSAVAGVTTGYGQSMRSTRLADMLTPLPVEVAEFAASEVSKVAEVDLGDLTHMLRATMDCIRSGGTIDADSARLLIAPIGMAWIFTAAIVPPAAVNVVNEAYSQT